MKGGGRKSRPPTSNPSFKKKNIKHCFGYFQGRFIFGGWNGSTFRKKIFHGYIIRVTEKEQYQFSGNQVPSLQKERKTSIYFYMYKDS